MVNLEFGSSFKIETLEKKLLLMKRIKDEGKLTEVSFDFSKTSWFDIGSLIFFIPLLNYLKKERVYIEIKLPESKKRQKARDFLRRWKFFESLEENVGQKENLISTEHLHYFDEKQKYYLPSKVQDPYGNIETLLSTQLVEITSFTKKEIARKSVSVSEINKYVDNLEKTTVRPVLEKCLGLKNIEMFSRNIVKEGLLNTEEHPHATISLLGMSQEGTNLVVGIVDNGKAIPETIGKTYLKDPNVKDKVLPSDDILVKYAFDRKVIEYATFPGTTSMSETETRYDSPATTRGMGLFYLKRDTLKLGGRLQVRAGNSLVTFKGTETGAVDIKSENVSLWPGNLIKILLPLKH